MLLIVASGALFGFWMPLVSVAAWTCGLLCIHTAIIRSCSQFIAAQPTPAATRQWRTRFIVLDLLYGLGWTALLIHPRGFDAVSDTLIMFLMLLVVAVSSMLAASLPIAALAATAPVTAAIAVNFALSGTFDTYVLALLALRGRRRYFALLAHRLHSATLATLEARAENAADRRARASQGDLGRSTSPRRSRQRRQISLPRADECTNCARR